MAYVNPFQTDQTEQDNGSRGGNALLTLQQFLKQKKLKELQDAGNPPPGAVDLEPTVDRAPAGLSTPTPAQQILQARGVDSSAVSPDARSKLMSLLNNQQQDADRVRESVDAYEKMPQRVDFSPLAGLVDSWTGSNFSKTAKIPETPEEKAVTLAKLRRLAGEADQGVTKDQISLLNAGNKEDSSMAKAMLMLAAAQSKASGRSGAGDWRTDRIMSQAADSIHKAPNLKTYTDLANSVGETLFLANKPDATVVEAHEALQNLTRAIGRSNVSSDYKQKQLALPTLEENLSRLKSYLTSDPNQKAPVEVMALINKMGGRVLDTYDSSIKREANRAAQGKLGRYRSKEANEALQEAHDFYTNGTYMNELRSSYGVGGSELPELDKNLKKIPGSVSRPAQVEAKDWEAATPAERKALQEHFATPTKK